MQLAGFFFYIDLSQKEENIAGHKDAEPTVILRNNRKYVAK